MTAADLIKNFVFQRLMESGLLQVVAVTLPGNMRLLGFVTRTEFEDVPGLARPDEVAVYLPMSYQVGGFTVFMPRSAIAPVQMSREDAMKFILTAGLKNASPAIEPPGEGLPPATAARDR